MYVWAVMIAILADRGQSEVRIHSHAFINFIGIHLML